VPEAREVAEEAFWCNSFCLASLSVEHPAREVLSAEIGWRNRETLGGLNGNHFKLNCFYRWGPLNINI